jgi:hypothetical protein
MQAYRYHRVLRVRRAPVAGELPGQVLAVAYVVAAAPRAQPHQPYPRHSPVLRAAFLRRRRQPVRGSSSGEPPVAPQRDA